MASSDVEQEDDVAKEETILYELGVLEEWSQDPEIFSKSSKEPSPVSLVDVILTAGQRSAATLSHLTGFGHRTLVQNVLPKRHSDLINFQMGWKLAVTDDGNFVAILQDHSIEIRSAQDEFNKPVASWSLPKDPHPQWRVIAWSPDGRMLAVSTSAGAVTVYDIIGSVICSISDELGTRSTSSTDLSLAVCAIIFKSLDEKSDMYAELLVVNYLGALSSYLIRGDGHCQLRHIFHFGSHYSCGVTSALYDRRHSLLLVGGEGERVGENSTPSAMHCGITAWRLLSGTPHYKLVTDYETDLMMARNSKQQLMKTLKKYSPFHWSSNKNQDGVYKLSLSPDGSAVAAVHQSGALSVWHVPSLRYCAFWPTESQPGHDEVNQEIAGNPKRSKEMKDHLSAFFLTDVAWWSDAALILARGTGAVTVSSVVTLANLLGSSPEWFSPAPLVSAGHGNEGFLGLECECKYGSLKRPHADEDSRRDDDFEDSDDENDATFASKTKKYLRAVMYFVTDSEKFQPPRKRPKLVTRKYRLTSLQSTTPEELFTRKIAQEEYGNALSLAKAYGLDSDKVYQQQWRKSRVSVASIQDYLSKIKKRSWVLRECLERVPDDYDAIVELLQYGLRGTDLEALITIGEGRDDGRFILCETVADDDIAPLDPYDPVQVEAAQEAKDLIIAQRAERLKQVNWESLTLDQKELCRARRQLLQFRDRLHTYEAILGGMHTAVEKYDKSFFEKFRSERVVQLAVDYARACDARALGILMKYHAPELTPHRLAILANFPETFSPLEYRDLLPTASTEQGGPEVLEWDEDTWREDDWVEQAQCRVVVDLVFDDGSFLYENNPDYLQFKGAELSIQQVEAWYKHRACEIERLSFQVDNALELLVCGEERHIQGLKDLHDDFLTMETLVYEGLIETKVTFEKLRKMKNIEKLRLLMSCSTDEMFSKNLMRWLVPFLRRCEGQSAGVSSKLLAEYLVGMAEDDLTRPLMVFQNSRADMLRRVIEDENELLSLALDCIYASKRNDQLTLAFSVLECLPQRSFGMMSEKISTLHNRVDQLECHLSAAEILERNKLPQTISYIRESQSDIEETKNIFLKLTRVAGREGSQMKETEWKLLLKDLQALRLKVYKIIEESACYKIFVESLLCSGCHDNISLAGKLLERSAESAKEPNYTPVSSEEEILHEKVAYEDAVSLVISAAQEYFNSAHTLTHPSMDLARSCLSLIADCPPAVAAELDLIEALALLEGFGVNMLPMQVRMCQDRLQLVQKAIDARPYTYKNSQRLLKLGRLLAIEGETDIIKDGRVLQVVTRAALKNNNTTLAFETCSHLMEMGFAPIWQECKDLAQSEDFQNIQAKCDLLAFAVTHCKPEMMAPILQARCLLETQMLYQQLQNQMTDRASQSPSESPFSARGAMQHTKNILSSTDRVTRSVLSTVSDGKWWKRTLSALQTDLGDTRIDELDDGNLKFDRQGCHPYYESIIENCYSNTMAADYSESLTVSHRRRGLSFNQSVFRTALLKQSLTDNDSESTPNSEVLIQLARDNITQDSTLGLAYLLALDQPLDAENCFEDLPKTAVTFQLAMYFYAIRLCLTLKTQTAINLENLHQHDPYELTEKVMSHIKWRREAEKGGQWAEGSAELVDRLLFYNECLIDLTQSQLLHTLDRGIDLERFITDSDYKKETILGLAMSLEPELYNIAANLAERHSIALWDVYMVQLEALFDSGLSTDEINHRMNELDVLSALKSKPQQFSDRMKQYVYPSIAGNDHAMLTYYYTLLDGCPVPGHITADTHCKLLKKISTAAPELDYRHLTDGEHHPLDVIRPVLTQDNINIMAKLASKIPDKDGSFLQPSIVFCGWAIEVFWNSKQGSNRSPNEWIHNYEHCGEYMQKMIPGDIVNFIEGITFVPRAIDSMSVEVRTQIIQRAVKFCKQHSNKKKQESSGSVTWTETAAVMQQWLHHLGRLTQPALMSLSESDDVLQEDYARQYDLSRSQPDKVNQLLLCMVLDGQELDLVEGVRAVAGGEVWSLSVMVQQALSLLTQALRSGDDNKTSELEGRDPMETMTSLVTQVSEHMLSGGELVTMETVMEELRVFCADVSVSVGVRLELLHLLEKTFTLTEEDLVLLTLYRTEAVVSTVWPDRQLSESDVVSDAARQSLYDALLSESTSLPQFLALKKLLNMWPPLSSTVSDTPAERSVWGRLMYSMVSHCPDTASTHVISTLKELTEAQLASQQMLEYMHGVLMTSGLICPALKVLLLDEATDLHDRAVELMHTHTEFEADEELVTLILSSNLAARTCTTHVFPAIIRLVTDSQASPDTPEYLRPHTIAKQLYEADCVAEAGSLMARARGLHSGLTTFDTVLGMLHKWFKA